MENTMFSGESKNIEYKVTLPDKSEKYMKTIVAFANSQGGKLIIGVDDKTHQIRGVEIDGRNRQCCFGFLRASDHTGY